MAVLPNAEKAIIPYEKFTEYALHPIKGKGKAYAFEQALGYDIHNADKLIMNIRSNLKSFPAIYKGDNGYGVKYEVLMSIKGENGKIADVLTSWIIEHKSGVTKMTSAYVTSRRSGND